MTGAFGNVRSWWCRSRRADRVALVTTDSQLANTLDSAFTIGGSTVLRPKQATRTEPAWQSVEHLHRDGPSSDALVIEMSLPSRWDRFATEGRATVWRGSVDRPIRHSLVETVRLATKSAMDVIVIVVRTGPHASHTKAIRQLRAAFADIRREAGDQRRTRVNAVVAHGRVVYPEVAHAAKFLTENATVRDMVIPLRRSASTDRESI